MPTRSNVIIIWPNNGLASQSLAVAKSKTINDYLPEYIGVKSESSLKRSTCEVASKVCVLIHAADNDGLEKNEMATRLLRAGSKNLPEGTAIFGNCVVLTENDDGTLDGLEKSLVTTIKEAANNKGKKRKAQDDGGPKPPSRAKKAWDFFNKKYQADQRIEAKAKNVKIDQKMLHAQAKQAWKDATQDEKAPFQVLEDKDKEKYEAEFNEYKKQNPQPPRPSRKAPSLYQSDQRQLVKKSDSKKADTKKDGDDDDKSETKGDDDEDEEKKKKTKPWKELTADEKAPYDKKAKDDVTRYELELETFREACKANGKDADAMIEASKKKKQKKKTEEDDGAAEDQEKKKKKKRSSKSKGGDAKKGKEGKSKDAKKAKGKESKKTKTPKKEKEKEKKPSLPSSDDEVSSSVEDDDDNDDDDDQDDEEEEDSKPAPKKQKTSAKSAPKKKKTKAESDDDEEMEDDE